MVHESQRILYGNPDDCTAEVFRIHFFPHYLQYDFDALNFYTMLCGNHEHRWSIIFPIHDKNRDIDTSRCVQFNSLDYSLLEFTLSGCGCTNC